ncbi:DUF4041 domain-containing protein [Alteribacter keqinensis]|uniref:DUF4041 domain-containing protein n=1 Tax=Alteribacter keqinensis TaxID=2483800 RepID=A0A3M7TSC1_9BACI|nr:DUF4041 domain-containing protein [Alteribacter keqinensis]RNA68558.1 DUF4041 domain-containing protein [Alteribacter keqinensis]
MKQPWYLQTWFIALWFSLTYFIVPFFIGVVLLIWQFVDKKRREKEMGLGEAFDKEAYKERAEKEAAKAESKKEMLVSDITKLETTIQDKRNELVETNEEVLLQSFGFYDPKYEFEKVEDYKLALDRIRQEQKQMVKDNRATNHADNWTVDGSKKKGEALNKNNIKLTLRAFNNECDAAITKVTFANIDAIEKRIKKAKDTLDKTNKNNRIEIRPEYMAKKIDELYLAYEYQVKKEEEKEEQRQIKEQMREEKRIQQEIELEKKKLEKEEQHFANAKAKYLEQYNDADEEMKKEILAKMAEIDDKLAELEKAKHDVDFREQNARAGYVYIISNIGSFGENVYKIGMTRRLEPDERIKELGNASVPFMFDVHAMVFSEDAPKLESTLHKVFEQYQVNRVNPRKEFFRVTLDEIIEVVKQNHNKTVEVTKLAEAEEYRKSKKLEEETEDRVAV